MAKPPPLILKTVSGGPRRRPPPLPKRKISLLTPEELDRYKNLYAMTQTRVEGYLSGRHKSPFQGASSDFADYHEYTPGQPLARIDWRVYGRSKKLFIRRFEEETDMAVYVVVDVSRSMYYGGADRIPKFIQAARLAAAISYLAIRQRDKVALGLVADSLTSYRKAGGGRLHLQNLLKCLEAITPTEGTSLARALTDCTEVFRQRGRLVLISDFHDDLDSTLDALSQFSHRGFEIQLLHLLDPDERSLPASAAVEFIDMESGEKVKADINDIRELYAKRIDSIIRTLGDEAVRRQMRYNLLDSGDSFHRGLEAYLSLGATR